MELVNIGAHWLYPQDVLKIRVRGKGCEISTTLSGKLLSTVSAKDAAEIVNKGWLKAELLHKH